MSAVTSGWRGPGLARVILWIVAIVTPLYWIIFFTTGNLTPSPSDFGYRFELAFPAADLWMAAAAVIAAIGLARGARWRRRWRWSRRARFSTWRALTFFSIWKTECLLGRSQTVVEATINVSCVAFGIYLL